MLGRAAIFPSAQSTSAAGSKPDSCWSRSPPRSSSIRSRRREGTLAQLEAALQQAQANRDLAQVTWDRDGKLVQEGWVTQQQGDTDRLTLEARDAAVSVAAANIVAQKAQLRVLEQQKTYQSVVAPFDGVITQRNIDVGSLVQADATSGTFLFTLMHSDVLRIQLYVPQDEAFGIEPGVKAVVRVPEMPGRGFPGTVTRIADALQPGTRTLLTEIDVPNPDACSVAWNLLHGRTENPAKDALFDRSFRGDRLQPRRSERRRGRERRRPLSPGKRGARFRHHRRGKRWVKDGDQVILNPPVDLTDGHKVSVRAAASAQAS